jgi:hypothetical protein
VNVPLTAGVLTVLVVLLAGSAAMQWAQSRADQVRRTSYAATEAAVRARAAAFDARSLEGRGLLGSGAGADRAAWTAAADEVDAQLARARAVTGGGAAATVDAARAAFDGDTGYRGVHNGITDLAKQDLAGARELAINPAPRGGLGSFEDFDNLTAQLVTTQQRQIADGLAAPHLVLLAGAWLGLLCGLAAAALALSGISRRLEEYR